MQTTKHIIGNEEWFSLRDLGIPAIKARVDTGAKTSALHAFNIKTFKKHGKEFVGFDIHPIEQNDTIVKRCTAEIVDQRTVKSSMGKKENRYVISTPITLGLETWNIEVTLANRDQMGYRMLLGREAMEKRFLVDPELSFCSGDIPIEGISNLYPERTTKKSGLKILLLASNPELYSNRRLLEAAQTRGHEIQFANIKQCYINICNETPRLMYKKGQTLNDFDGVIPRIRPSVTYYGCAILRHLESLGVACLNTGASIEVSRDKLQSLQILAQHKIPVPTTGFAHLPKDTESVINLVGGSPLIVKLLEGTQGKGVVLAETKKAAESVINAFKSIRANILVQEFIKEAQGKDIRCFVVGGKVISSIQREAAEGEFRANLHLGGKASKITLTKEEKNIAISAAKAMGLEVAGVDIIRSSTGPKVLEVNSSPGLEGIEKMTERDIADKMIECLEKKIFSKKDTKRITT